MRERDSVVERWEKLNLSTLKELKENIKYNLDIEDIKYNIDIVIKYYQDFNDDIFLSGLIFDEKPNNPNVYHFFWHKSWNNILFRLLIHDLCYVVSY